MSKFHICLVCPHSLSAYGGVQEHTLLLAREFEKRGYAVTIVSPTKKPRRRYGKNVYLGTFKKVPSLTGGVSSFSLVFDSIKSIREKLDDFKPDIVHIQDYVFGPSISWQIVQAFQGSKVITFHSGWDKKSMLELGQPILKSLAKLTKRYFDASVTVSNMNTECFKYLISNKNEVIPPAVDISEFQRSSDAPKEIDSSKFNMLFVGRFDKRKNVLSVIKALRYIDSSTLKKMHFYIIGDGKKREKLVGHIEKYHLENYVTLLGALPSKRKIQFMQHCDLLIAPTLFGESFGMILVEALASGTPVLAGDNDGYKETLRGYPSREAMVDCSDPKKIAVAIIYLYNNPEVRERIVNYGTERIKDFSVEMIIDKHLKLYSEVIDSHSPTKVTGEVNVIERFFKKLELSTDV